MGRLPRVRGVLGFTQLHLSNDEMNEQNKSETFCEFSWDSLDSKSATYS
jgi:hypothetical protein